MPGKDNKALRFWQLGLFAALVQAAEGTRSDLVGEGREEEPATHAVERAP